MADVLVVSKQIRRRKVVTVTVGSSTVGHTFTLTTGNGKAITYTAVTGDTTTTIGAAVRESLNDAVDGEFSELEYGEASAGVFTVTGPDDGAPFTLTASGTGTMSATQTTAPLSPYDAADVLNYSTGALPTAGGVDTLTVEAPGAALKYNLTALAAIDLVSFTRRAANVGGTLGLPAQNPNGYPEYRTSEFEVNAPTQRYELNDRDGAQAVRVRNMFTGSAVTVTVMGPGPAEVGQERVEIRALPASSVVNVSGGSIACAPYAGQVCVVATLLATNATVRLGSGVTLTTASLQNCNGLVETSWGTSLTMVGGGEVEVGKAAAGANSGTIVYKGTLRWKSTGATGNSPVVGSGGVIDFTEAPAAVTVGGTVVLYAGSSWLDPAGRCGSYSAKYTGCTADDVTFDPGTNKTVAVS